MRTLTGLSLPEASHKAQDRNEWSLIVKQMLGRHHSYVEKGTVFYCIQIIINTFITQLIE